MPATLEIAAPPEAVRTLRTQLDQALDAKLPAKLPGGNIIVGTWNVRAFAGLTEDWDTAPEQSPKRNFADLVYIAAFIRRCDVVAVQEVRGNLRGLRHLMDALGQDWAFILTDVNRQPGGNDERLAFLFDTTRVKPSGLACELVGWMESGAAAVPAGAVGQQFVRTPYAVSFISAGQTFILVTLHIDYGKTASEREPELSAIAEWLASWGETEFKWNHNVIPLGDFNLDKKDDPRYQAFISTGLKPAPPLADLPRTIFDTPRGQHYYDQIAWFTGSEQHRPSLTLECLAGGNFDFVPILQQDRTLEQLSWHISDHYPLWVEFAVPRL